MIETAVLEQAAEADMETKLISENRQSIDAKGLTLNGGKRRDRNAAQPSFHGWPDSLRRALYSNQQSRMVRVFSGFLFSELS
jgi:hypothetical protein